jgi:tetratricopeptide (TPR) repeat protein
MRRPLLLGAALCAWCTPAEGRWREASSDHFVIYSEGSEGELRDFAMRLERYASAMRHLRRLGDARPGKANRLTVYVVSNPDKVRRLAGAKGSSLIGFYLPRAIGSMAIIPRRVGSGGDYDIKAEQVLLHEYAHHFLYQNYAAAYPAWFSEGFAEFHSTVKFNEDGSVGIGLPALHRAHGLMGNPLPVEKLLEADPDELAPEQREAIYSRGWLLTHYLTMTPGRVGQLQAYLRDLNAGRPRLEAAKSAFGGLKALDKELDRYLVASRMKYFRIAPDALKLGTIALRELSAAEEAVMDVKIESKRGVDHAGAKALLPRVREAAAPFPADPAAQVTLAEAEFDAGNYAEAEAAADRALAADPKLIDALLYKGRARMAEAAESKASNAATWKEVRRWFVAANRLDPDDPEPLMLFYDSFRRSGAPATPNAVAGLIRAYELAPQDRDLRLQVARQHLIDGKAGEARGALAPIAFDPHAGGAGKIATALIASIDANGAPGALQEWREAEAEQDGG